MVDGPDLQVDALLRAERLLHLGEALVRPYRVSGAELPFTHAGADDVDAVHRRFGGDAVLVHLEAELVVLDVELEMLAHAVLRQLLTHPKADPCLALEPAGPHALLDFR